MPPTRDCLLGGYRNTAVPLPVVTETFPDRNRKPCRCRITIGGIITGRATIAEQCARSPSGSRTPALLIPVHQTKQLSSNIDIVLAATSMSTTITTTTTTTPPVAWSSHPVFASQNSFVVCSPAGTKAADISSWHRWSSNLVAWLILLFSMDHKIGKMPEKAGTRNGDVTKLVRIRIHRMRILTFKIRQMLLQVIEAFILSVRM